MPLLAWVGWLFIALIAWAACTGSNSKPSEPGKPWAAAPKDGNWPSSVYGAAVPFGETTTGSKKDAAAAFIVDYTFSITSLPELTTYDEGKNVWIASRVNVNRVDNRAMFTAERSVSDSLNVIFRSGDDPQNPTRDEAFATNVDIKCDNNDLTVGQSTVCTLSFKAAASEIRDCYWEIDGWAMGTWPSQGKRGAAA